MRKSAVLLTTLTLLAVGSFAQSSSSEGDEEIVALSPFTITADADSSYSLVSSLSGSRLGYGIVDGLNQSAPPSVPISITKKADAVVIQFSLVNNADKQEVRNQELYSTVRGIQAIVDKSPGLRMEQREVRFASGNRKIMSFSRGPQSSYASIVIFADIAPELRLADRVKQVRDVIDRIKLPGATKLVDGTVGLYVKQPASHRREILQKIFDDLDFVKKGLGSEFEVRATGLSQNVRLRACSETEVELWIDYSFQIDSVRSLSNPKK
jgi:hypothetical protein